MNRKIGHIKDTECCFNEQIKNSYNEIPPANVKCNALFNSTPNDKKKNPKRNYINIFK